MAGSGAAGGFTVPAAWHRNAHERRGGPSPCRAAVDRKAAGRAKLPALDLGALARDGDTHPWLRAEAAEELAGRASPLIAAGRVSLSRHTEDAHVVDAWALDHGVVFAALAVLRTCWFDREARIVDPDAEDSTWWRHLALLRRARALLAAASDEDHAAAVAALDGERKSARPSAIATYLVPGQPGWVEQARDGLAGLGRHDIAIWRLLLHSVDSPEQLRALLRVSGRRALRADGDVLHTLGTVIGPDLVPFITHLLVDAEGYRPTSEQTRGMLVRFATAPAFDALLGEALEGQSPFPVLEVAHRRPRMALERFAAAGEPARELLLDHVRSHPDLLDDAPAWAREVVAPELAARSAVPDAVDAELPAALVTPPWEAVRELPEPLVVEGVPAPDDRAVVWRAGLREVWAARSLYTGKAHDSYWNGFPERFERGELSASQQFHWFAEGPLDQVLPRVADWTLPELNRHSGELVQALVNRFEVDAFGLALDYARNPAARAYDVVLPLVSVEVARLVAARLDGPKSARPVSARWVRAHPEAAARLLLADAVGPPGERRAAAEAVLRMVPEQARAAAEEHGEDVVEAVERVLSVAPLDLVPSPVPDPGWWCPPEALPRLLLRGGGRVLPDRAVRHVTTMLAMTLPGRHYAGVDVVREVCDPESLARFAEALLDRWLAHGLPAQGRWALFALAQVGDDAVVRRLVPLITAWPGQSQHHNAVAGLDVLAGIGSEAALVALSGIAQRAKFTALKQKAVQKVAEVAEDLGLTAEQLGDRLVPTFGLDGSSALVLDYGPRSFTVGFDEKLVPFVLDASGKRLKSLPKPGAKDDPELAPAEQRRFAALKKDVRAIAADQVARLERAMVAGRDWSAGEFTALLAGHPLVRHLVRGLVWTADGAAFRVAEDGTFADAADEPFELPPDARVALPHPLRLPDLPTWSTLFADYEVLQPFPQLARPVHRLTGAELAGHDLSRFVGAKTVVVPASVKRAWELGPPADAGMILGLRRPLPGGASVWVELEPGLFTDHWQDWSGQRVVEVELSGVADFAAVDEVLVSEVVGELVTMTAG
ncbi:MULTISPECIES: DUF4132 domain-containing protein [Actinosynnema]|uniref:DUF4132 domain-containing protein n=1 Tax=Actinosynnema TaxID=40566 RepID=UPI0027E2D7DA|nr:DUF4132 domain-containing protein [Actinosynnema pretiosum]MCP2094436.1 protein of unknown function (DUF4132) [Actinosynnema pretiosum]